ncbi:MAG: phage scaffolding protein [Oscillospiraceae bacterium]
MLDEKVKSLLGEELSPQVEEALKGKGDNGADVDLVVGGGENTGIPEATFQAEKQRADNAEKQLATAAEALKELGASGDKDKLSDDVQAVKDKFSGMEEEHAKETANLRKASEITVALGDSAYNIDDVLAKVNLDDIKLGEDGKIAGGVDPILAPIRESHAHYFKTETTPEANIKGAVPGALGGAGAEDIAALDDAAVNNALGLKGE